MTIWKKNIRISVAVLLAVIPIHIQAAWPEKTLARFSDHWNEIQTELSSIESELKTLPDIPLEYSGGTGGLLEFQGNSKMNIFVRWGRPEPVDLLALVPAHRLDSNGLNPEFGLPDSIEIRLLDQNDHPVYLVAQEHTAAHRPIQRGFPFIYSLPKPVFACGVHIRCADLYPQEFIYGKKHAMALAELFCFSGQRNVAENAPVELIPNLTKTLHWLWREEYLTDGLTPLGLPEIPAPDLCHIGWLSDPCPPASKRMTLDITLDRPVPLNGFRMFPLRRTFKESPPGFGFPQRFRLIAFDKDFQHPIHTLLDCSDHDLINGGNNPETFRFPEAMAQYIRLDALKLWKQFPNHPAFLALSEIQLLHGETNWAEGACVEASNATEPLEAAGPLMWSVESLTNGHGPQGKLIPQRDWLLLLDRRLELETRQLNLQAEAESMAVTLQKRLSLTFSGIGSAAILGLLILPVCYRFRERRRLNGIQQRLAGDLHDEVGSNLGSIQILAELSCQKQNDAGEMSIIGQIAAETVSAVRDIVWLLRPHATHRVGIVDHLRQTASIMLKSIEWDFHAEGLEHVSLLNDEDRSNLLLFYREALHNLIRHAQADKAVITLHKDEHFLTLEITDNGRGMEPGRLEQPATLHALKQRAQRMQGELTVFSEKEKGTRLTLRLPLASKKPKRKIWRVPIWMKIAQPPR